MKESTNAVLLSALVFPGSGHLYLKRYFAGAMISVAALSVTVYIIIKVTEIATGVTNRIQDGGVQFNIQAITDLVSKQLSGADTQSLNMATTVLIVFWVVGIVDVYRIGRVRD